MQESALREILSELGITVLASNRKGWLTARCPFAPWRHKHRVDRSPSFGALICDDGISGYRCPSCGSRGRISSLVRSLEYYRGTTYGGLAVRADLEDARGAFGTSFEHAVVGGSDRGGAEIIPIDESTIDGCYDSAIDINDARSYLLRRGISSSSAQILGLLYDPDEHRILFPVRTGSNDSRRRYGTVNSIHTNSAGAEPDTSTISKGDETANNATGYTLYGFTGRTILSPDRYPYPNYPKVRDYLGLPKQSVVLGAEFIQEGKPIVCVEGLFGYASLIERGVRSICNPVALLGSVLTEAKADFLDGCRTGVYLLFDQDIAGDQGLFGHGDRDGAVDLLIRRGIPCYVPEWDKFASDIDNLTYDDVEYILENCLPYSEHS